MMVNALRFSVSVSPNYLPEHSEPDRNHFVWAYKVRIENTGQETVQLINRHWQITDAAGRIQEVKGPGVVGEQPILAPGDSFVYSSGSQQFALSFIKPISSQVLSTQVLMYLTASRANQCRMLEQF